ncbi:MAG: hypothetical protein IT168_27300 [Bryobacterales bacterium]|nr:hypothetical protein [Bryobacterales bacterium]
MISFPKFYCVGIALLVFLSLLLPAQASVLNTYSDSSSFNSATSNATVINFDGTTPNSYSSNGYTNYYGVYSNAAGLTINGVNFVGNSGYGSYELTTNNATDPNAGTNYGTDSLLVGPSWYPGASMLISLPSSVTAFSLDMGAITPAISSFEIQLVSLGVSYNITTALRPNLTFFGVTLDAPIDQVRIATMPGGPYTTPQLLVDNFVYATAGGAAALENPGPGPGGETPEVTTILYVTSGIGLLIWKRRRMAASF